MSANPPRPGDRSRECDSLPPNCHIPATAYRGSGSVGPERPHCRRTSPTASVREWTGGVVRLYVSDRRRTSHPPVGHTQRRPPRPPPGPRATRHLGLAVRRRTQPHGHTPRGGTGRERGPARPCEGSSLPPSPRAPSRGRPRHAPYRSHGCPPRPPTSGPRDSRSRPRPTPSPAAGFSWSKPWPLTGGRRAEIRTPRRCGAKSISCDGSPTAGTRSGTARSGRSPRPGRRRTGG